MNRDEYINSKDWNAVQEYYDDGGTWRGIIKNFKISNKILSYVVKCGIIKLRNKSDAGKIASVKFPMKHTEETKKKISEIRKKYLAENPEKVPYLLNHSSKESYPESYFTELFKNENIKVDKSYQIGLYELDFCILSKKIDIEIDGDQHYLDRKIMESDKRRAEYLKENGWDIIRIKWSDYQMMKEHEKINYIKNLKNYIDLISDIKPTIVVSDVGKYRDLCECGNIKYKKSNKCLECYRISRRKVDRPSYETLLKDVEESSYCATGRKYGVSGKSIKKWIKNYEDGGLARIRTETLTF